MHGSTRGPIAVTTRSLIVALSLAAGVFALVSVALFASGGGASSPECLVAPNPIDDSIAAPSDLTADLLFFPGGFWIVIEWADNTDVETCYVVERGPNDFDDPQFSTIAVLEPDSTCLIDASDEIRDPPLGWLYRVYAATGNSRSEYSNLQGIGGPVYHEQPSPSPPTPIPGCFLFEGEGAPSPTPTRSPESPLPTVAPPFPRADLNCNGLIELTDALSILRFIAGLDANLPSGCASLAEPPP